MWVVGREYKISRKDKCKSSNYNKIDGCWFGPCELVAPTVLSSYCKLQFVIDRCCFVKCSGYTRWIQKPTQCTDDLHNSDPPKKWRCRSQIESKKEEVKWISHWSSHNHCQKFTTAIKQRAIFNSFEQSERILAAQQTFVQNGCGCIRGIHRADGKNGFRNFAYCSDFHKPDKVRGLSSPY